MFSCVLFFFTPWTVANQIYVFLMSTNVDLIFKYSSIHDYICIFFISVCLLINNNCPFLLMFGLSLLTFKKTLYILDTGTLLDMCLIFFLNLWIAFSFFNRKKFRILLNSNLSVGFYTVGFFFFCVLFEKSLSKPKSLRFSTIFFSTNFIDLALIFRSMTCFELIYM